METIKLTPKEQAAKFVNLCREYGWTWKARPNIVEISKEIVKNSNESFTTADMEYGSLLDLAPLKGGSTWGTDGGGIGGMSAMRSGTFTMKKSGTAARFIKELQKL